MKQLGSLTHAACGNLIMARFLGAKNKKGRYEMHGIIRYIKDKTNFQHLFLPHQMMFDTSWDWLMTVYKKISELPAPELPEGVTQQTPEMDEWSNRIGDITCAIMDVNLDDAWDETLNFLEWYNTLPKIEE